MQANRIIRMERLLFGLCLMFSLVGCADEPVAPPVARVMPITSTYHGVDVIDNYQWLENSQDQDVQAWDSGQNNYTRSILDAVPCRQMIEDELRRFYDNSSSRYSSFHYQAGKLFAKKMQPPNDQAMLVRLDTPLDPESETVIVDPNKVDSTGKTHIDWFVVSHDGSLAAVSLSRDGTEDGHVSVYRIPGREKLDDYVPHVNGPTAGGDVAWLPDNSGFYYTHYPRKGERAAEDMRFYQQVYWHELGTPTESDTCVIGEEFPRIAEIDFETSPDGSGILAVVSNGDGGEYDHWLREASGEWSRVTRFEDAITKARFGDDNSLYLLSSKNASLGKILKLAPGETDLGGRPHASPQTGPRDRPRTEGADQAGIVSGKPDTNGRQPIVVPQLQLHRAERMVCVQ
jgi:prolyl oligopeptidase